MPHVVSVNVGRPRPVQTGRRTVSTAIWKTPVEGRVAVRGVNVDGDDQADRSVHGGPDKAVYAYASEEIRRWRDELGRDLGAAPFGENLTTAGIDVSGALVGERWRIGTTLLEVVQPRLPCFKLGLRMGDPAFVRRFAQASRPGAYLRIVEEGELGAGARPDPPGARSADPPSVAARLDDAAGRVTGPVQATRSRAAPADTIDVLAPSRASCRTGATVPQKLARASFASRPSAER
jgi:MOSC domain-containing protein YiiM